MDWLRWQKNPWGQEILRGLAWDVAWLAIALGCLFIAGHALLYVWRWRPKMFDEVVNMADQTEITGQNQPLLYVPERVLRHSLPSRLFHWSMAAAVLVLLCTAYGGAFRQ